ncbi:MAG: hybrid sensor histidine kinase/response regulator [Candidatus Desantisbacteria bacterium]
MQEERVNILLVDDTSANLLSGKAILAELGQNIVCAHSGEDALKYLLHEDFAVILMDVNMPGLDGFETAALIRQRPRSVHTPIIFVTATGTTEMERAKGYLFGAVDYIFSPVTPEILRAKVSAFCDLFRMSRAFKLQAEELSSLNERLIELDRLKSNFISMASHELKTPITSIMGFSELLLDEEMDRKQKKEYLQIIYEEAKRLTSILNDLLDISRIEEGKRTILKVAVNLREIIEDSILRLKNEAMKKKIRIINTVSEEIKVMADRDTLIQILINLLSNAVKYSYNDKDVAISCELSEREAIICVIDQGIGITCEELSHIFTERFYRSERSEVRSIQGTGLGLSIVKGLVEISGGRCWAESDEKGSRFRFTLPLV